MSGVEVSGRAPTGSPSDPDRETREIGEVVERLAACHPDIDPVRIGAVVTAAHRVFDGRPIRHVVPVFVERPPAKRCPAILADTGTP